MHNQVDVNPETIDAEWAALESGAGLDFSDIDGAEVVDGEVASDDPGTDPQTGAENVPAEVSQEDSINMAAVMISGGINLVVAVLYDVDIDEEKLHRCSHAWAVVICKYYQGGIFEFLERYKHEIAAIGATLTLGKAIKVARHDKAVLQLAAEQAKQATPVTEGASDEQQS